LGHIIREPPANESKPYQHHASELDDPDNFCIVYTHHRDSGLLDQSNAVAIEEALDEFTDADDPDVIAEHHTHFACGWIDGFAIRVFRDGRITEAFRKYHELAERMAQYPVLDEEDHSRREYEATIENIRCAGWHVDDEYDLPEDWPEAVYSWLFDNIPDAIESSDDQGGWPEEDQLREAFEALGYDQLAIA